MERMYSSVLVLGFIVGVYGFREPPNDEYYEVEKSRQKTGCRIEDVIEYITVPELEDLIVRIARKERISPSSLLTRLYQKAKNKQRAKNDDYFNSLENMAINELIDFPLDLPPFSNNVPSSSALEPLYQLPSNSPLARTDKESGSYFPVLKPIKSHRPPPTPHSVIPLMIPIGDPPPKIPVPDIMPFSSQIRPLRPPPGIVVRINPGDNKLEVPDVVVTASPLMTVVEALRQADLKYQRVFGLSPEDDVIAFNHFPWIGCFVVSRFENIVTKKGLVWKMTILDQEGKVVYDGVCVPTGKEIVMKPGMQISLTYTEIQ